MNDLTLAMHRAAIGASGEDAVQAALVEIVPDEAPRQAVVERLEDARAKAEAAAEARRRRAAALADAVEIVARHRSRLGRRICSVDDGDRVDQIFSLLRGMHDGPDPEAGFAQ